MNIDETLDEKNIGQFRLKFKDSCSTFYSGSIICGSVEIEALGDIELRGIRAQFRGEVYVYWQNRLPDGTYEVAKDHHTIWNQLFTIWGKKVNESSSETVTLPRGEHVFPFAVKIPLSDMPSSFEHRNGAVRYWVKVYVDQKNVENNRYKAFTVLQKVDVSERQYQMQVCNEVETTMCCSCFGSTSLSLKANIDRSGYCPGESIVVNCRGKNEARRDMGGIKARLIQSVTYTVGMNKKKEENIISAIGGNKIEKGRTKVWENQLLKIPAVPPTIENFPILSVTYKVQVTLVVPNGVDLQFYLPVTVGTRPKPINDLNYLANVRFKRCTEGIECFNHSSKTYNFPLLAYVPSTAFVDNFVFVPNRRTSGLGNQIDRSYSFIKDEEKQLLISNRKTFTA